MIERPTVRQLEYLVALADKLHFGRAAHHCHVTQPALSVQISALEKRLGAPLFERDRRRVIVTTLGHELARRARTILADVDALGELAGGETDDLVGPLGLGAIPTVAPYVLPHALSAARKRFPRLRPYLREDVTEELVARVVSGDLDVVLVALPLRGVELETHLLYEDPFFLALPSGHPLARAKRVRPDQLGDLDGLDLLLLDEGHCLRDQALEICARGGGREHGDFRASSLGTLTQMVAAGIGATLLPATAVDSELRSAKGVVVRPFVRPAPTRRIALAWRPSSPRSEAFRALGGCFRAPRPQLSTK